jgi:hypothetical protein
MRTGTDMRQNKVQRMNFLGPTVLVCPVPYWSTYLSLNLSVL